MWISWLGEIEKDLTQIENEIAKMLKEIAK